ncbi:hypothetical protein Pmani_013251 [Petrolisthes manimaculis]|uniref:Uncharacterized protein n=1 Tax=Petrolisthes manimaculis TaxID=1843537 RepID=A0AAE1UDU9_9EUCA|nr:hypothetical protein Pmani_013251 [Petrolisthes manimaculis]
MLICSSRQNHRHFATDTLSNYATDCTERARGRGAEETWPVAGYTGTSPHTSGETTAQNICASAGMADFKEQFEQKLDNLLQSKNDNVVIPRKEKRAQWIAQLLKIEKEGPKTSDDYNMKKKSKLSELVTIADLFGSEVEEEQDGEEAPQFAEARQLAAAGQEKNALRMTRRAKHLLNALEVGDNATLKVPEFNRVPSDSRNLLVVVLQRDEDLYQVGCREGRITTRYTAAVMDPVKEKPLTPDEVPDVEMALRTAVTRYTGGQGYVKCSCKPNCTTSRCSCTKKLLKCNSRCHPGRSCNNI